MNGWEERRTMQLRGQKGNIETERKSQEERGGTKDTEQANG